MHHSSIKTLNNIMLELDGNSQSAFTDINFEVSKNCSSMEDLIPRIASEADKLLNDLQINLRKQEERLKAYAQQQREAHTRALDTARSVSKMTANFFTTLDLHAAKLNQIMDEALSVNDQKLSEFEKKFEEHSAKEERELLEKVAELLANSHRKKKKLVQSAVLGIQESAVIRASKLQQGIADVQASTSTVKAEWIAHMEKTESQYMEDTETVEYGKKELEVVLEECLEKAKRGAEQWNKAQEAVIDLEKCKVASVESIVGRGMEVNRNLSSQFCSTLAIALEGVDTANKDIILSIDHSLKLDHDACENLSSTTVPCHEDLEELEEDHYNQIVETKNAGKCLIDEYALDEPSCSTPRKRSFNLPSTASIEEMRTPAFDELFKPFWDLRQSKLAKGELKHVNEAEASVAPTVHCCRDPRIPFIIIN
ncbi:hypothetical protein SAY87_016295 [Trapa incisa]|uniref:Uncharacterized protein n=1 Tax=Trapa incisa TaxID=236973 RepID=A0AAN7L902_9MYRT|nr:hypothetical protein SAY87_016295 [Trapa incisa]